MSRCTEDNNPCYNLLHESSYYRRRARLAEDYESKLMNIAIIGGGFTGLSAAYELGKLGHQVTVFEKDTTLGGLANGFKGKGWDWHLEMAYHHLFTNDTAILHLIKELNLTDKLIIKRPVTATLWNGVPYPLDSPLHLLRFPGMPLADRIRTGVLLGILKINPFWRPLELITAKQLFLTLGGGRAWKAIWEPLMVGKFGNYSDNVAASWLWARIKKRTPKLYYIEGGFHTLVAALEQAITDRGGKIKKNCLFDCDRIFKSNSFSHTPFDKILLTIPVPTAIPHLHAQTLILETKEPILYKVYWLNITDRTFPFLAVVAHTNMIDKKHYGGHHLTYIGNYLPSGHPYLSMTKEQLLKKFKPFLRRISNRELRITNSYLFNGPYAQPVHERFYSSRAPKLETPIPGVFLANMDSIYPWDRGTNYAVELGQQAASTMSSQRLQK